MLSQGLPRRSEYSDELLRLRRHSLLLLEIRFEAVEKARRLSVRDLDNSRRLFCRSIRNEGGPVRRLRSAPARTNPAREAETLAQRPEAGQQCRSCPSKPTSSSRPTRSPRYTIAGLRDLARPKGTNATCRIRSRVQEEVRCRRTASAGGPQRVETPKSWPFNRENSLFLPLWRMHRSLEQLCGYFSSLERVRERYIQIIGVVSIGCHRFSVFLSCFRYSCRFFDVLIVLFSRFLLHNFAAVFTTWKNTKCVVIN